MNYPNQQLVVLQPGNKYNRKLFLRESQFNIKNSHVKPKSGTGLWTSTYTPKGESPSGWFSWCAYNQDNWNGNEGVLITVKKSARVCTIDSYDDFTALIKKYPFYSRVTVTWKGKRKRYLNYVAIKKDFDIIYLTWKGQHDTHFTDSEYDLYGWDCECSLHLNNVIQSYKKVSL